MYPRVAIVWSVLISIIHIKILTRTSGRLHNPTISLIFDLKVCRNSKEIFLLSAEDELRVDVKLLIYPLSTSCSVRRTVHRDLGSGIYKTCDRENHGVKFLKLAEMLHTANTSLVHNSINIFSTPRGHHGHRVISALSSLSRSSLYIKLSTMYISMLFIFCPWTKDQKPAKSCTLDDKGNVNIFCRSEFNYGGCVTMYQE